MRHVKLALGTMLAVFGLLGAVGSGWGFWSYWSDCHAPDPMLPLLRHPASYLSAKRQMCSNQLKVEVLGLGVTLMLMLAAFFVVRLRGRRWLPRLWQSAPISTNS